MRISYYRHELQAGRPVVIGALTVHQPNHDDPEQGLVTGMSTTDTVELSRVLTAWLDIHKRLHPGWHTVYRLKDPGGETTAATK